MKLRTINKILAYLGVILIVTMTDEGPSDPDGPWTMFSLRRGRYPIQVVRS